MSAIANTLPGETSGATVLFLIRADEAPLTPADTAFLTAAIKKNEAAHNARQPDCTGTNPRTRLDLKT